MDRDRAARLLSATGRRLIPWLPLLFLALFYFWPLLSILALGLAPAGRLALDGLRQLLHPYYLNTLLFTCGQALLSTALTLALALPASLVFARYRFPGRSLLLSLATLAFVLPTVVVASAFSALVGANGLVNRALQTLLALDAPPLRMEGTLALILLAHVFYNFAVALRLLTSFQLNQSRRIEEAARVLGARGWQLWREVRLPLLWPALLASSALIFLFTFTSFGVVIILGELRFATLEVEIYQQAVSLFNLPAAAALSLLQILLMFALMLLYTRWQRVLPQETRAAVLRSPRNLHEKLTVALASGAMLLLIGAPLLALAMRSLSTPAGPGLAWYAALTQNARGSALFVPPLHAIGNSLFFALLTTVLALALSLPAAALLRRPAMRWLDTLFMLPLATSPVTLGFGFIITLDEPPLDLRSSPLLIPIAHTLVALPFVLRCILPALLRIAPSLREAACVLGARPTAVWRHIELPLISRGLVAGAIFAFTISMGEFGASLFVARPDNVTIPLAIFRLLAQPGAQNYGSALAMSVILMLTCGLGFALIERMRGATVGAF